LVEQMIRRVREILPEGMPLLVKVSAHEHIPKKGVTPALAVEYAARFAEVGIDGLEVSRGAGAYSFMHMLRGDVPVEELAQSMARWKRPLTRLVLRRMADEYPFREAYNLDAIEQIRPALKDTPLLAVGGFRTVERMNHVLDAGHADFISLSRPLIREPFVVRRLRSGKSTAVKCESCNRCFAAVMNDMPVRCYVKKWPSEASG
jgi:2,4-dienoyl-CoA reductase-like NADH-dependent reductase (Old Yellow Enzyme family)